MSQPWILWHTNTVWRYKAQTVRPPQDIRKARADTNTPALQLRKCDCGTGTTSTEYSTPYRRSRNHVWVMVAAISVDVRVPTELPNLGT